MSLYDSLFGGLEDYEERRKKNVEDILKAAFGAGSEIHTCEVCKQKNRIKKAPGRVHTCGKCKSVLWEASK